MKTTCLKSAALGAVVGLADGLAFVIAFHTAADFLVPFLFWAALPCPFVVLRFNWSGAPEWLPWTAGVLTTAIVGAVLGLGIGCVRSLWRRKVAA